jgi:hypothetical protein
MMERGAAFDPHMVAVMRTALDEAWSSLAPEQKVNISQSAIAERILKLAAKGETDPERLVSRALQNIAVSHRSEQSGAKGVSEEA